MIGYGDRARTQCEVVRLFRETHPDLPPLNHGTISKIEAQYREMGHVRKVPSKRQAVVDDDTKLNLLLALEENPITPARQLARDNLVFIYIFNGQFIRHDEIKIAIIAFLTEIGQSPGLFYNFSLLDYSKLYSQKGSIRRLPPLIPPTEPQLTFTRHYDTTP
ncbi:hypothetical protein NQ318_002057 [Aromia moschata]|uniref:DUF4817 domain-containing protein n=1 Tax=Aromia moschata TaxID=1265417 RepID=A0AAV8Z205_9CUCU|nr:hypothetical protein NQ318_002057 [Aromia moschata]